MSCDMPKQGHAVSRSLITDNLMASGSPSHSGISQYAFEISVNMLGTPPSLQRTTSPLALPSTTWLWRSVWGSIPEVQVFAHGNMLCARFFFYCAQKSFAPEIYISNMLKNICVIAKTFI